MDKLIITPKTKIFDLLEAYPQLEGLLIACAPPFKKLRNPILRKTITKITTLNQAATIGGINVDELVNKLRSEIGQGIDSFVSEENNIVYEKPVWFTMELIVNTIDIREMLHDGEQPVHEVLSSIKKLNDKEILKVVAPFIPAPLIEKSLSLGYKHWLDKKSDEEFNVFFLKS